MKPPKFLRSVFGSFVVMLAGAACERSPRQPVFVPDSAATPTPTLIVVLTPAPASAPAPKPSKDASARPKAVAPRIVSAHQGIATWYDPPEKSRVARRAPGELTAASDHLPMGSTVRVVNLANGRSVLVRITDRGVNRAHAIDLCKEAAYEIGLVGKGKVNVRVELLADAERVPADRRF